MQPIKLKPIFKEKIWGSDRLRKVFDKDLPADSRIGESWELVDFPTDCNTAVNEPYTDKTLREILHKSGLELGFNDDQLDGPFGLLIKFLDAGDDLSIQVHPDRDACKVFPGAQLKTECWLVLAAEPDGLIYKGFKPGIGKKELENALLNGVVGQLLNVYPARPGDFHFLPAGTVHALGAGVLAAEIQTPSDTTFRIFDWNRKDPAGKPRDLHITESLQYAHYTDGSSPEQGLSDLVLSDDQKNLHAIAPLLGHATPLIDCEFFGVIRASLKQGKIDDFTSERPAVMIALSGNGRIVLKSSDYPPTEYVPGDTIILPKLEHAQIEVDQPGDWLLTCLGPVKP